MRDSHLLAVLPAALCALMLAACAEGGQPPRKVAGGDPEQGLRLIEQYQCGACHAIPGAAGAQGTSGPSLDHFGRSSYIAGRIPNLPEALVPWLVDPPAMKPGTLMPAMGVSESEARHMAAYLYTLQ